MWCWRKSRGNQRRPTYQTAQERRQKEATLQLPPWEMGLLEGKMQIAEKRDEKEVKKKQMGVKQFVKMTSDSGAMGAGRSGRSVYAGIRYNNNNNNNNKAK